ncbi:hypothetical protein FHW84_004332 [Dyella sp. SG562]|jgi:hypothetical protein|uniref:hypothetical protein n=1 Tax=Dyella TaxID=231454 RepID=UPI0014213F23|nr:MULTISPECIES: hypothetical protein [unclassified Dyella]NII75721.1 hypothetical protein [Dyella sp. SG562]NKJ22317.1 hypothetical protein [Dyella sp. SG609]
MNPRQNPENGWREVEGAVLAYLTQHPDAADTLDGIVSWWLPQQRYVTERRRIEQALSHLVERGQLRRDRLPGGAVLYALNRADPAPLH